MEGMIFLSEYFAPLAEMAKSRSFLFYSPKLITCFTQLFFPFASSGSLDRMKRSSFIELFAFPDDPGVIRKCHWWSFSGIYFLSSGPYIYVASRKIDVAGCLNRLVHETHMKPNFSEVFVVSLLYCAVYSMSHLSTSLRQRHNFPPQSGQCDPFVGWFQQAEAQVTVLFWKKGILKF